MVFHFGRFGSLPQLFSFSFQFKTSTDEQKMLIFEIFDRVAKLQSLLLSEISWLYTVFFYGACLVIAYLITATRRTADARSYCALI